MTGSVIDRHDEDALAAYPILRFFEFAHLPPHLTGSSKTVHDVAWLMARHLPRNAETSAGLRKLLEAKDCFVRAML